MKERERQGGVSAEQAAAARDRSAKAPSKVPPGLDDPAAGAVPPVFQSLKLPTVFIALGGQQVTTLLVVLVLLVVVVVLVAVWWWWWWRWCWRWRWRWRWRCRCRCRCR